MAGVDPDLALRQAAVARARQIARAYDDLVPLDRLRAGFEFEGARVSFGSFQRGIHRARIQRGPAALTVTTSFNDPYADTFDQSGARFTYAYRAGPIDQPDNRALRAAYELQTPLVYFRALAPGQYLVVAPMFVTADDSGARTVVLEPGLPIQDLQPGGLVSGPEMRAYTTAERRIRLHQQRFKLEVMRAYRHRCAICALRERSLVQAAHIIPDVELEGIAAVVNGLALCAIHHLAFDRNVLGIDPDGVVHIARRLLEETTDRCCGPACRGSTARRSRFRVNRRIVPTQRGSKRDSHASSAPRPEIRATGYGPAMLVGPERASCRCGASMNCWAACDCFAVQARRVVATARARALLAEPAALLDVCAAALLDGETFDATVGDLAAALLLAGEPIDYDRLERAIHPAILD